MRTALSFAALFLSVILLQLSSGGVGPLDALVGQDLGFAASEIGFLGSAHFVGFFVGCWWAPRLMGAVGHSRAFATFTAMGAVGLLGHTLITDPIVWSVLRVASGMCIAGCYTVIEAWLQSKATNETRGRTMGAYRVADMGASMVAQLMIGALASLETYLAYNTLALFACAALLPLMLTRIPPPQTPKAPRLHPGLAWSLSPLAVVGVVVAAMTASSFRMVGPLYGIEMGLSAGQIGAFLATWVGAGALAQYPVGWAADRFDRRWVMFWISVLSIASCAIMAVVPSGGSPVLLVAAAFFGLVTFPIYSLAASHAHDFAETEQRVELSAALMFWYATGAIGAPWISSVLVGSYGPGALFVFISVGHLILAAFGLSRMRVRAAPSDRTPYVYAPRTSFTIGRLLGRSRDRKDTDE